MILRFTLVIFCLKNLNAFCSIALIKISVKIVISGHIFFFFSAILYKSTYFLAGSFQE